MGSYRQSYRSTPGIHGARRAGGFSLVELLLALSLGLVVVTGIVQLFVGNSQTYTVLNGQARLQENGRFALEFISRAARSSGFLGCAPERDNIVKGLRAPWGNMPEFNILNLVQGFEGSGGALVGGGGLPDTSNGNLYPVALAPNNGGIDDANVEPGTDVVAFRTLEQPGTRLAQVLQPSGNPVVAAPGGVSPFAANDVVMVADCEQGALFRINSVNVAANQATLNIVTASTGNAWENADQVPGQTTPTVPFTLSYLGRSYGDDAIVSRVQTTYFFIADSTGDDNDGDGQPPLALWQKVGTSAPQEVVQGVEDLEVMYGIDTQNDNQTRINEFVNFDAVADPTDVVAVRVSVTVNSVDVVDNGQRLRRTFSKTIQLRNANPEV
ncbi:MAG: PilW family protein [Pseudomonadales bacterium]